MRMFVSSAIIAAALLTAACGNQNATASETPTRVRVEVAEPPTVTATRCFMRVRIDRQIVLVDFRKPLPDTILQNQQRNFEICEQARQGDTVVLDPYQVG